VRGILDRGIINYLVPDDYEYSLELFSPLRTDSGIDLNNYFIALKLVVSVLINTSAILLPLKLCFYTVS